MLVGALTFADVVPTALRDAEPDLDPSGRRQYFNRGTERWPMCVQTCSRVRVSIDPYRDEGESA
jgi:hypothetical protein